jgi:hypothetical protein
MLAAQERAEKQLFGYLLAIPCEETLGLSERIFYYPFTTTSETRS